MPALVTFKRATVCAAASSETTEDVATKHHARWVNSFTYNELRFLTIYLSIIVLGFALGAERDRACRVRDYAVVKGATVMPKWYYRYDRNGSSHRRAFFAVFGKFVFRQQPESGDFFHMSSQDFFEPSSIADNVRVKRHYLLEEKCGVFAIRRIP